MALTPEAKVKKQVKKVLDDIGAYHFSPLTAGYGRSGVPDIIVCYKGKFIGIECKAHGNKPTALQQSNLEEIVNNGGIAIVIDETSVFNLKQIIEETEL